MTRPSTWARYYTPTPQHRDLGLYCLGVGRQEGQAAPLRDRALDCYAAVLVTAGRGRLAWPGAETTLVAPVLFWLFPGVTHTYAPTRAGWDEQWVLFDGLAARTYEDLGYLDRRRPAQPLLDPGPVRDDFAAILARASADALQVEVDLAALVHRLVVDAGRDRADGPYVERSDPVVAMLRARACEPRSVSEFAAELGLSAAGLRTAVRSAGAGSPKELIVSTRLTRAKHLLAQTELSVQQVAREVGYADPGYFTRLFTARVGRAPRDFREQQRRTSDENP